MKTDDIVCKTITVKDRIILTNKDGAIIQIKSLKGSTLPTKLQILDSDDAVTHELTLNTTDGTSGDISTRGAVKRVA